MSGNKIISIRFSQNQFFLFSVELGFYNRRIILTKQLAFHRYPKTICLNVIKCCKMQMGPRINQSECKLKFTFLLSTKSIVVFQLWSRTDGFRLILEVLKCGDICEFQFIFLYLQFFLMFLLFNVPDLYWRALVSFPYTEPKSITKRILCVCS